MSSSITKKAICFTCSQQCGHVKYKANKGAIGGGNPFSIPILYMN
jgi:hypothetical protein